MMVRLRLRASDVTVISCIVGLLPLFRVYTFSLAETAWAAKIGVIYRIAWGLDVHRWLLPTYAARDLIARDVFCIFSHKIWPAYRPTGRG